MFGREPNHGRQLPSAPMLTSSPRPQISPPPARDGDEVAARLLAPGDEVSIMGAGTYEIVHLSHGRAWLSSLADGMQQLADATQLRLRRGGSAVARH